MNFIEKRAKDLGVKMVDAKKPLKIEVLPVDVAKSKLKDPGDCAFSRACRRSMPVNAAYFFRTAAWLEYTDKLVRYKLPASMQKEIVAFDRNRTMEPGLYQLAAVPKSQTATALRSYDAKRNIPKKSGGRGRDGKIKRRFVHKTDGIRSMYSVAE